MKALADRGFVDLGDQRLEVRMIGPRPDEAPTLVLLHEGLGSADLWGELSRKAVRRDRRRRLPLFAARLRAVESAVLPRPLDYMQHEGTRTLPRLLDAIGFRRGLLIGHSDGASIAAVYAGSTQDHRVRGRRADRAALHRRGCDDQGDHRIPRGLRHHRSARAAGALACRRRSHRAWLERRLAEGQLPRTGISRTRSPISASRS